MSRFQPFFINVDATICSNPDPIVRIGTNTTCQLGAEAVPGASIGGICPGIEKAGPIADNIDATAQCADPDVVEGILEDAFYRQIRQAVVVIVGFNMLKGNVSRIQKRYLSQIQNIDAALIGTDPKLVVVQFLD